jgi:hypothetical protein
MKPPAQRFQAAIYKIWMMRHVDVPAEVADALIPQFRGGKDNPAGSAGKSASKIPKRAKPKYVPVVAIVNGAFDELTTGHRRHFIKWFDSAKGPDTRIRRLGRAIDFLLEHALSRQTKLTRTRRK